MTKNFCDICGKEATDYSNKSVDYAARAYNEKHALKSPYAARQLKVTLNMSLVDRDTNVSQSEADICSSCLSSMLAGTFYTPPKVEQ